MLEVIEVSAAQTFALRAAVLRPHLPLNEVSFGDENAPDSRHFAAITEGAIVGAGYISPISEPNDADADGATAGGWQLRGMSVSEDSRGRGIGRAVLLRCIEAAREENAPVLWCNARVRAAELYRREGFVGVGEIVRAAELYRREGFVGVGEIFGIAGIGPHLRMRLAL